MSDERFAMFVILSRKVGQVLDSIVFPQIKEPVWCVYLGGTVTVPCCRDELEVIV